MPPSTSTWLVVTTVAVVSAVPTRGGGGSAWQPPPEPNPVADPLAMVHCDQHTRFTVLAADVIRAESSVGRGGGRYEDRATFAFVNRRLPVPAFKVANGSGWCNISTALMHVAYRHAADPAAPAAPAAHPGNSGASGRIRARAGAGASPAGAVAPCVFGAPRANMYLPGCATGDAVGRPPTHQCPHSGATLAAARAECAKLTDCGGVTARSEAGDPKDVTYESRRGPALVPTPAGSAFNQTSWPITNLAACGHHTPEPPPPPPLPPPPPPGWFALHRLSLAVPGAGGGFEPVWGSGATPPSAIEANQRDGTLYQLNGYDGDFDAVNNWRVDLRCRGVTTTLPAELTATGQNGTGNAQLCTQGVLSFGGWTVYSDEINTALDDATGWADGTHLLNGDEDLYIFASGKGAHRRALQALTSLAGKAVVPPRRFFGVHWSRWNKYSEVELKDLVAQYAANGVPLDGINMDTEWHRNQAGYLDGNGASWYAGLWDWDESLYLLDADRHPTGMIDWLEARGLWPVWMDVHQGTALPQNSRFAGLAKAMNVSETTAVPCDVGDSTYVSAWFKMLEEQVGGRNYWWLDSPHMPGQLDHSQGGRPGLNSELWNRIQFFEQVNETKVGRPTVMGPYGGLGTHRYPFVHSGDTITSWATLAFLPQFAASASNVLASYISHDAGGHRDYGDGDDQELYVRSIQYTAFSAQLRPHAAKVVGACHTPPCDIHFDRRVWEQPYEFFAPLRAAMVLRAQLVPYSYTAALTNYLDDVPFLRHVYVDFPGDANAEAVAGNGNGNSSGNNISGTFFMFGPSILVAPVVTPRNSTTNLTAHLITLPALPAGPTGEAVAWVERGSGRCLLGGLTGMPSTYTLDETAEFVRGGSIIPMTPKPTKPHAPLQPPTRRGNGMAAEAAGPCSDASEGEGHYLLGGAARVPCTLHWHVYLGNATQGSGLLLEDDGRSTRYLSGEYTKIVANYSLVGEHAITLTVQPAEGGYTDLAGVAQPSVRPMVFVVHNVLPPVLASSPLSAAIPTLGADSDGGPSVTVTWDAAALAARVRFAAVDPATGATARIAWPVGDGPRSRHICSAAQASRPGFVALHARALAIKKRVDWEAYLGTEPSMALNRVVMTATRMDRNHSGAGEELAGFEEKLAAVVRLHTGHTSAMLQPVMQAWLA